MAKFAGGSYDGMMVNAEPKPKRGSGGPTIRTARDYRVARDMLMKVARDAGFNRFDMAILFPIHPDHANRRLQQLNAALHRESRRGL